MYKRLVVVVVLLVTFFVAVTCSAAKFSKDDEWLIYIYACGADLEENQHDLTKDISQLQQVRLPKNIKVLINANGARVWHHPTLKEGGNGIYLYSANRLQKLEDRNENMVDPQTLKNFLEYGERNFNPAHKILIFFNHGGLNGLCYDYAFGHDNLSYDDLTNVFSAVYSKSPEEPPFELIGFNLCISSSYELANSIANFAHYMIGSEPSMYGWNYTEFVSALAKDPSMNGAQIGKVICDSAMESYAYWSKTNQGYPKDFQNTQAFSVIDLTKMPVLREATEEFFGEALKLSNEQDGFSGAFARAFYAKNADNYSNWYTDLGMLARNTKDLMPKESKNLRRAINKAVVHNRHGSYLNATGISTAYPYLSSKTEKISGQYLEMFLTQNSMPNAQKTLYRNDDHAMAELDPEQLENVLRVGCMIVPVVEGGDSNFGLGDTGAVVLFSDELDVDWKKGTVTENIRVQHMLDGHKIMMIPTYQARGYKFYEVPVIVQRSGNPHAEYRNLQVRYDISKKEYFIMGIANTIDNGMAFQDGYALRNGDIITPVFLVVVPEDSSDLQDKELFSYYYVEQYADENDIDPDTEKPKIKERVVNETISGGRGYKIPNSATGESFFLKPTAGASFVYSQNSRITEKKIGNGNYLGVFQFVAPDGNAAASLPFTLSVRHGEIERDILDESDLVGN